MRGAVWTAGGCDSWYLDATGRNSTLWPGGLPRRAIGRGFGIAIRTDLGGHDCRQESNYLAQI